MRKLYLNPRLHGVNNFAKLLQLMNVKIDAFITSNQLSLLNHESYQLKFPHKTLSFLFTVHPINKSIIRFNEKKLPFNKTASYKIYTMF